MKAIVKYFFKAFLRNFYCFSFTAFISVQEWCKWLNAEIMKAPDEDDADANGNDNADNHMNRVFLYRLPWIKADKVAFSHAEVAGWPQQ